MEKIQDTLNYIKLSEPFDGMDNANAAMMAFYDDVRAVRNKHRIADCSLVCAVNVRDDDGRVGIAMSLCHNGDHAKADVLLSYALGKEQEWRREFIADLLKGKEVKL